MQVDKTMIRKALLAILTGTVVAFAGCGDKEPPATADTTAPVTAPATPEETAAAAEAAAQTLAPTDATWTPEALEELLAPIALYPDAVLGLVLVASTNPQEVLDAGNWLLQNEGLEGDALDEAAEQVGFTPPMRGLMQFPETVDMMCLEMGWTEELGQAYVNDQAGVLESVQRLRAQAKDVGNLASSEQMTVNVEVQEGEDIITVAPADPQIVYVPQYDPVAAYAPAPAAPAATTTTVVEEDEGHSTGTLVTTGLLSFGAGLLVANIFDDDDDDYYNNGYYNPYYPGRPPPYYPPYPYRPSYGNGYYPGHGYNRPPNYRPGGNNTVIINQDNNYWNNYGDKPTNRRNANSPISQANPRRSDLDSLNARAKDGPKRPAPSRTDAAKVQGSYAGARESDAKRPAATSANRAQPKVQGSYAGARPQAADNRPNAANARPDARPAARPASNTRPATATDRGRPEPQANKPATRPAARPEAKPAARPAAKPARASQPHNKSAVSGANHGSADRAASARGKQSMPKGVPPKAKSGGASRPRR